METPQPRIPRTARLRIPRVRPGQSAVRVFDTHTLDTIHAAAADRTRHRHIIVVAHHETDDDLLGLLAETEDGEHATLFDWETAAPAFQDANVVAPAWVTSGAAVHGHIEYRVPGQADTPAITIWETTKVTYEYEPPAP